MNRRRSARFVLAGVLVGLLSIAGATGASAHALPQSSDPAPGADLSQPPTAVRITFGERPDPSLSTIRVLDSNGKSVTSGPTTASPSDPSTLSVPVAGLGGGVYTVAWRTVSTVDGHTAAGSFAFGVGTAPPVAGSSATTPDATSNVTAGAVLGRWLLYLGLFGLFGPSVYGLVVGALDRRVRRWLLPLAWLLAVAGTAVVVGTQLADAGVGLGDVMATSFGAPLIERAIPLLLVGLALLLDVIAGSETRLTLALVAVGAGVAIVADVLGSHAAAGTLAGFDMPLQLVHVGAAALWLGGLAGLVFSLARLKPDVAATSARRFAALATTGILTVGITGITRAFEELSQISDLWLTVFGLLVVGKTVLLGALAGLGAINHFRNVPRASDGVRAIRRVGGFELLIAATVLLLTATMVNVAPPSEVAAAASGPGPAGSTAPATQPLIVGGSDFGTTVKLRLEIAPGGIGFNTFTATAVDYDTGAPVSASGVTLRFSMPTRTDIGGSRLDLTSGGAGTFAASGPNLSLAGAWSVDAVIANGANSVTIPLTVIVGAPANPTIDVNAVSGLPTIYTVHLSEGRTAQLYLDPGKPGANELHVTYFDATGNELPVTTTAMAIGPVGGVQQALTPRELEPGHFVADTTLAAGTYLATVAGPAPNGDQLVAQVRLIVSQ
jgi:copper transport protein